MLASKLFATIHTQAARGKQAKTPEMLDLIRVRRFA